MSLVRIVEGLRGPLTLVIAPAGFGKTTLVASCVAGGGMSAAWLSLDKDDNQEGRFLTYLVATLQEADHRISSELTQLVTRINQGPPEAVLTSLVNDLEVLQLMALGRTNPLSILQVNRNPCRMETWQKNSSPNR